LYFEETKIKNFAKPKVKKVNVEKKKKEASLTWIGKIAFYIYT
jgi:hypothetical protein